MRKKLSTTSTDDSEIVDDANDRCLRHDGSFPDIVESRLKIDDTFDEQLSSLQPV